MKSLTERMKEKADAQLKERMRRSTGTKYRNFGLPITGHPSVSTEGDVLHVQKKAKELLNTINSICPWQFTNALLEVIVERNSTSLKHLILAKERRVKEEMLEVLESTRPATPVNTVGLFTIPSQ